MAIHWIGHEIIAIGRNSGVRWDGRTVGPWAEQIEGADLIVNLAGRSVNCRYTESNLKEMMASRVESTLAIGDAVCRCKVPPRIWLQSSTATIYADTFGDANGDDGVIGGNELNSPRTWKASVEIAKAWEASFFSSETPKTRKIALRSSMIMSPIRTSVFGILAKLARSGLGGRQGDGKHYVSWIHEVDFCRALDFLVQREDIDGTVNVCSPNPLPQAEFAELLRDAVHARFSFPLSTWMLEIGAWLRQTETELILKSRRVTPTRLLDAGFTFEFPFWLVATRDLAADARQ